MTEKQIEQKMTDMIHQRGGLSFKFTSPNAAGVPDRVVILPDGKIVFVELKAQRGRVSELQSWQIARMKRMGADARVLRGLQEVQEFINEVLPV